MRGEARSDTYVWASWKDEVVKIEERDERREDEDVLESSFSTHQLHTFLIHIFHLQQQNNLRKH